MKATKVCNWRDARKIAKDITQKFGTKVKITEWSCQFVLDLDIEVGEEKLEEYLYNKYNKMWVLGKTDSRIVYVDSDSMVSLAKYW